jgi:dipeptidyl aminopeptidase/acylaminoacyl peptidase
VISFADSITHKGSRFNLTGPEREDLMNDMANFDKNISSIAIDPLKKFEYSNERHVTSSTPPAFIVHANDDNVVPVQNTILFVAAMQDKQVNVQPFFYASGGHGFGLHNTSSSKDWMNACLQWLRKEGISK